MVSEPKIGVIGVGPVGGILAAHLARAGHTIVACDIQVPHLTTIEESGISISGITDFVAECAGVAYGVSDLTNFPELNTIIVATKAAILPQLVPEIAQVAKSTTCFIICQNGLDNEHYLAEAFNPENILRVVINYGGSQMGDGHIFMSFFNPPNYIGAMTPDGEPLAQILANMLTESGLETHFTTDISKYEWEKVVLNAALNPVCAITRKPMKDMMDLDLTEALVEELLREGIAVAEAAGITFDEGFLDHGIQYLKKAGYHRTSMHQDILRKIPTEIDWISRKVVEKGCDLGVLTPYNFAITALVKGLEMKSGAPGEH
jgi:2-dehydropantoate 2-reductase